MANNNRRQVFGRLGGAIVLVIGGLWAAGLTPLAAFGPAPDTKPSSAPQLKTLSAKAGRRITTITIETSDPVAYLTSRPDPLTLLLDLRDVEAASGARAALAAKGVVAGATVEDAKAPDGARVVRVRIALTQPASHQVRSKRNVIYVDLDSAFPLGSAGVSPNPAAGVMPGRFATSLEAVRGDAEPKGAVVTLTGNGELSVDSVTPLGDGTARVVLEFPNVRSKTPPDTFVGRGPVSVVHVTTTGAVPTTRVVIDLLRPASYRVVPPEDGGKDFKIYFEEDGPATAVAVAPPAMVATLDPIGSLLAAPRGAGIITRGVPQQQQQQGVPVPGAQGATQIGPTAQRFSGNPVTLDFQGADLRVVLRTFADISGLNIVIDQAVQGSVDVALHEVPWDQALDIILKDHKLGYSVDGTIVRIAPITVLADEETQRRKLSDEQALTGELQVLTRPLSYAKAVDLTPLLTRTALSPRGDVQIDTRTNTIIIRDLASRLQGAAQLIDSLDRPQPQVEIEARIVTTTRNFARELGVQWGFNGRVAQDLGNTTGLAFPNQGSITGRTGNVQGPVQGVITDHAGSVVNLGIPTASSAIGLALGSVNGSVNLDIQLSALESSGNGRILSTPRVTTQNNVPAEITQGVQIPIQTVSNNTITVSFRDAALKLNVTPQITASNTVILNVALENSTPDFSRAINGIPPIDTQRALTSLLVNDGQTTVIGGIYVSQQQATNDHTPGVYKIPLLGWLFRRETVRDQSRELLIFITPRVIKM
ncbi:MAG: type IV pilus secretin PilQ [Vicinamibacterales bacterium]|nr:type IV pilus secretin PilQ [Vicinamibacterales bacterium]